MSTANPLLYFDSLSLPQKIEFLQASGDIMLANSDSAALYQFFKKVIANDTENAYIRKKALEKFINGVLIKKIKVRQALTLLIDEWNQDELYLEIERIKALYLFYDHDQEAITTLLQTTQTSDEAELAAEAMYHLAMIYFQEALAQAHFDHILPALTRSKAAFLEASTIIENRIDAYILYLVNETVEDLLKNNIEAAKSCVSKIGQQLFQFSIATFGPEKSIVYVGFYRTLVSVVAIVAENPTQWLSFRDDMGRLFYYFSLIQNEKLENMLFVSTTQNAFTSLVTKQIVDPFFALNFRAEKTKVELLIKQLPSDSENYKFLSHLRTLLDAESEQVKLQSATITQSLRKIFAHRTQESIDRAVQGIADINNVHDVLNAYEMLAMPSIDRFTDKLIYSCVMLQGNKKYWGNCLEDDRNTFIASLLEAADYKVKDQTRWSVSHGGKAAGEIDILVRDDGGLPFTIIEALNLDSLTTDYLELHLNKLFKYDANGLRNNFILVYFEGKKFDTFWQNYYQFILNHNYPYPLIKVEQLSLDLTDLKFARTVHLRNQTEVDLYHLVIDLKG